MAIASRLPPPLRLVLVVASVAIGLVLLAALALEGLHTDPGRALVARQIARIAPASGLRVAIGRIEGRPLSKLVAYDVVLSDPRGRFLEIPELALDWQPLAFARGRLIVNAATAPEARLLRLPELRPSADPEAPLLPSFDILLGRLAIERLVVEPAVAGTRQILRLSATADVRAGRALARADASSLGGDRLALRLDARPDDDRFDLDARLDAPVGGLFASAAGLGRPLSATVSGDGGWARWRGRIEASAGGASVARLALAADAGRFGVTGVVTPAAIGADDLFARLGGAALAIDARLAPADGGYALALTARSDALALAVNATTDDRFGRIASARASGRLLRPAAVAASVSGGPVDFALTASGAVAAPLLVVEARAPSLAVGATALVEPRLSARADLARRPITADISLTAARAAGLGSTIGDLAQAVRVAGVVTLADGQALADRFTVATTRITAAGSARLDLASGAYAIALDGQLPRYALPGIGTADLDARLRIVPGPGGRGFAVTGPFRARVLRLESAALARLAGGLPVVTGEALVAPDGGIRAERVTIAAPRLRLSGNGAFGPGDRIAARAEGRSADYGPILLTLGGTSARPALDLAAARPGLGIGLAGLTATLRPAARGFAIVARGRSDYGAFTADATLDPGAAGGLAIDVERLAAAGFVASGRLVQGPRALGGTLALSGPGITGTLVLDEAERVQRVVAALSFADARLAVIDPALAIGRGRATATVLLLPAGLAGSGAVDAARLTRGTTRIDTLTASGSWRGGAGNARVALAGKAAAPFRLVATLAATASRLTVAADGQLADTPLRLVQPATITRDGGDWRLAPATLVVAGGQATLSGTLGRRSQVEATLDNLALDALGEVGALDIRGRVSGDAALAWGEGGLPVGQLRLQVARFTRAGLAGQALPVEIEVVAAIRDGQAAARVFLRRQGRVLGAAQARLSPIPGDAADGWSERLLAAPLSGQLRLQAPAEAVWPLAGIDAFDVRGPIALAADLSGRLGEPAVRGIITATGARIEAAELGTVITATNLEGSFDGPRLVIRRFTGKAGDGTLAASGTIAFTAAAGLTADIAATTANARVIDTDLLRAAVTGPARIRLDRGGGVISGDVVIDRARYQIGTAAAETVPALRVTEIGQRPDGRRSRDEVPTRWRLAVNADAQNRIEVRGLGLESEWSAKVALSGLATDPRITGRAQIVRGAYDFAGKTFKIDRGDIRFQGESPPNPVIDITATARTGDVTAEISITGNALKPEIRFTSTPALPEDEVLSRLLFGTSITNLSAPEALQLAAAVGQLRGGGGAGLNPINALRRATGLDRLRLAGGDKATGRGTTVSAGKYIGRSVYVELATDARGYASTQIEVALTRSLSILSSVASAGGNRVSVRLSKDY